MELDKKAVANRLKLWLTDKYGSIKTGANDLGKSVDILYNSYLNGRSLPGAEFMALLIYKGCDIEWLLTGRSRQQKQAATGSVPAEAGSFPIVSSVGAGSVIPYDDIPYEYITLPYKGEAVVLKVQGDSMAGLILEGDYVLVDLVKRPRQGHIVALRTKSGEQMVKYYAGRTKTTAMFYSQNAAYPPLTVTLSDLVTVKKVVMILKNTDYPDPEKGRE